VMLPCSWWGCWYWGVGILPKVEPAVEIHGGVDVLESGNDTLDSSDVLLFRGRGRLNLCHERRGGTSGCAWGGGHRSGGSRG
jgi:hypothetical protein